MEQPRRSPARPPSRKTGVQTPVEKLKGGIGAPPTNGVPQFTVSPDAPPIVVVNGRETSTIRRWEQDGYYMESCVTVHGSLAGPNPQE